jgi:NADH-quinone oxidoreductase subunit M
MIPVLSLLIFLPIIGGIVCWLISILLAKKFNFAITAEQQLITSSGKIAFIEKCKQQWLRYGIAWIAIAIILIELIISLYYWYDCLHSLSSGVADTWEKQLDVTWIPFLGIRFHVMLDGFSVIMVTLTLFLTLLTLLYSLKEKHTNIGLYYLCILWCCSSVVGLLTAVDLFLFFLFWEMVSIPLYFLVVLWGRRDSNAQLRFNGAIKLLIFTQASSLVMLLSIISLALINLSLTKVWSFDYDTLINTPISARAEFLLMIGFFLAFIVRMPLIPFHSWFIDAHIESSTTSSMMISGLLMNAAVYGILRFVLPIFPNASLIFAPFVMLYALGSLYYSAFLVFNQSDIKKLIAYVHIALISFLTFMIYVGNILIYQGVIIQMIAISLSITGLFMVSGMLTDRYLTRNIKQFIGLRGRINYLPAFTLFFVLAILGIPGTANFIGNLMQLFGAYKLYPSLVLILLIGLLFASIALLIRMQPILYGLTSVHEANISVIYKAMSPREFGLLFILAISLLVIGLYPQFILDTSYPMIYKIQHYLDASQIVDNKEGA